MILYHGSNMKVDVIDLDMCRPYKDFGRGFYLTTLKEQAENMAKRVARLHGGDPVVTAFLLDESVFADSQIRIMNFEKPCREWALFVMNNRDKRFVDIENPLCNQDNKYDLVIGAIANDDLAYLFRTFNNGLIDIDVLIKGLEYKQLTNQYSFHTQKAVRYLTIAEGM